VNWSPTSWVGLGERAEFEVLVVEIEVVMKTFPRRERLGGIYFVAWSIQVFRETPQAWVDNAELVVVKSQLASHSVVAGCLSLLARVHCYTHISVKERRNEATEVEHVDDWSYHESDEDDWSGVDPPLGAEGTWAETLAWAQGLPDGVRSHLWATMTKNQKSWRTKGAVARTLNGGARGGLASSAWAVCHAVMTVRLLTRIGAYAPPFDRPSLQYVVGCACSVHEPPAKNRTPSC